MKINKLVYSLMFCFCSYFTFSQAIFINLKTPASPTFKSGEVWNFDVINPSRYQFRIAIFNNQNGTLVEPTSNTVTISIGISYYYSPTIILAKSVKPVKETKAQDFNKLTI